MNSWVDQLSDHEIEQMKLVYMALYKALGLNDQISIEELEASSLYRRYAFNVEPPETSRKFFGVSSASSINSFKSGTSKTSGTRSISFSAGTTPSTTTTGETSSVASRPQQSWSLGDDIAYAKRFPPLAKLVQAACKHFKKHDKRVLIEKYRYLTRDSSDKFVSRYIRQYRDSTKAITQLAKSIAFCIEVCDIPKLVQDGEWSDINKDRANHLYELERGRWQIVGKDKEGRPIFIVRVAQHRRTFNSKEYDIRAFVKIAESAIKVCQEEKDGGLLIIDFTDLRIENLDMRALRIIVYLLNVMYPCIANQILFHNCPKFFKKFWKVLLALMDPTIAARIRFTRNMSDLLQCINIDQIPSYMGGYSRHEYKWIPPRKEDDAPMRDVNRRRELLREREGLLMILESLTSQWMKAVDSERIDALSAQRKLILAECSRNYWQLDPHIQSRTVFDRNGISGYLRPELRLGQLAQPRCIPLDPFPGSNEPIQTIPSATIPIMFKNHDIFGDRARRNTPQERVTPVVRTLNLSLTTI